MKTILVALLVGAVGCSGAVNEPPEGTDAGAADAGHSCFATDDAGRPEFYSSAIPCGRH